MKNFCKKSNKAFTLIELLVVVAIIGILASVVIASLSSAREKGKIATIKSTLKQLYNQASLNYLDNGSFTGSNDASLNCTGTNNNLQKIVQPLIDQGITVKCYSHNSSGNADVYLRFGATALIYDTGELKAWSVDENGVARWGIDSLTSSDLPGSLTKSYSEAVQACINKGGKLPSLESLKSFSSAYYSKYSLYFPTTNNYFSSGLVPSDPIGLVYVLFSSDGTIHQAGISSYYARVRCLF